MRYHKRFTEECIEDLKNLGIGPSQANLYKNCSLDLIGRDIGYLIKYEIPPEEAEKWRGGEFAPCHIRRFVELGVDEASAYEASKVVDGLCFEGRVVFLNPGDVMNAIVDAVCGIDPYEGI